MNPFFENALSELIISEKNNLDFFRLAAGMVRDEGTRQVFERLAGEGIGYLHVFFTIFLGSQAGNVSKLLARRLPNFYYPPCRALIDKDDLISCEQKALELSLLEAESSINLYTTLANSFRNPGICAIFGRALRKAHRHYEIVHAEYIRILGCLNTGQTMFADIANPEVQYSESAYDYNLLQG
jgi:rubrerythrin